MQCCLNMTGAGFTANPPDCHFFKAALSGKACANHVSCSPLGGSSSGLRACVVVLQERG